MLDLSLLKTFMNMIMTSSIYEACEKGVFDKYYMLNDYLFREKIGCAYLHAR